MWYLVVVFVHGGVVTTLPYRLEFDSKDAADKAGDEIVKRHNWESVKAICTTVKQF